MTFLLDTELNKFYPRAAAMTSENRNMYLARANAYAFGYIGGVPPASANLPEDTLKAAVALAFEILAKSETGADVNSVNGDITEAAPAGFYARNDKGKDPLETVMMMLQPYKAACEAASTEDKGVRFL